MDRLPWQPRQLEGEYGSFEGGEESFDIEELSREMLLGANLEAACAAASLIDAANADRAITEIGIKPNCLAI